MIGWPHKCNWCDNRATTSWLPAVPFLPRIWLICYEHFHSPAQNSPFSSAWNYISECSVRSYFTTKYSFSFVFSGFPRDTNKCSGASLRSANYKIVRWKTVENLSTSPVCVERSWKKAWKCCRMWVLVVLEGGGGGRQWQHLPRNNPGPSLHSPWQTALYFLFHLPAYHDPVNQCHCYILQRTSEPDICHKPKW